MTANRQTRRRAAREQAKAEPTLEQLAAAMQNAPPPPLLINLDNCRVVVHDHPTEDGTKEMLFVHVSGGVVFRAKCGAELRRELVTLLSAPRGIVIPNGADTPAA